MATSLDWSGAGRLSCEEVKKSRGVRKLMQKFKELIRVHLDLTINKLKLPLVSPALTPTKPPKLMI
jgi:hypothetical protein